MGKDCKTIVMGIDAMILPLTKKFAKEGSLSHLKKLMEEGSANKALSSLPVYTPTNWAALATGAEPGSHGAGNWRAEVKLESGEITTLSTFDSRALTAETIWETAERVGKRSLIIAYPGAWPPTIENSYVVAPLPRGLVSLPLIPGCLYTTDGNDKVGTVKTELRQASGWRSVPQGRALEMSIVIEPEEVSASRTGAVEDGAQYQKAIVSSVREGKAVQLHLLILDTLGKGYDRALIYENKEAPQPLADLGIGQWSKWIFRDFFINGQVKNGALRFKLLSLSADGRTLQLVRSEVYPSEGFTYPEILSKELVTEIGPYIEHPALKKRASLGARWDEAEIDTTLEELRYQALWHAKVAKYLQGKGGWDIFYNHWHWLDTVQHRFLSGADPASPNYNPEEAPKCLDVLRRSYEIVDEMVGAFLELTDERTYVIVVSDHGNSPNKKVCSLQRFLKDNGFTSYKKETGSFPPEIDLTTSKAYPHGSAQIKINLKGRDPHGIVSPQDYEKVQEEIIDALHNWRDPKTGKAAIALALKRKDAQLIGYWGERTGDVVFIYNSGFAWGKPGGESSIGDAPPGANHGPQIPTTETELSSNLAALIFYGPGIKKGYQRDYQRYGLIRLIDVVPTLCYLLKIPPPAQSCGAVLYDILEIDKRT